MRLGAGRGVKAVIEGRLNLRAGEVIVNDSHCCSEQKRTNERRTAEGLFSDVVAGRFQVETCVCFIVL
jgi:hypothetical protein